MSTTWINEAGTFSHLLVFRHLLGAFCLTQLLESREIGRLFRSLDATRLYDRSIIVEWVSHGQHRLRRIQTSWLAATGVIGSHPADFWHDREIELLPTERVATREVVTCPAVHCLPLACLLCDESRTICTKVATCTLTILCQIGKRLLEC